MLAGRARALQSVWPGTHNVCSLLSKYFSLVSHKVYLYSPADFDPAISFLPPPSLFILLWCLCVGKSSSGAAGLSHPCPGGGGLTGVHCTALGWNI